MSIFQKKEKKVQKNIRILIVISCVFGSCLFISLLASCFQLKKVEVTGCHYYTQEEIADEFKQSFFDDNTIVFYLKYKFFKDISIPFVDGFDMDFVNRNKIHINIYEKAMISCIKYMGEYLYLDKDGTIVETSTEKMGDIPLITGLTFDEMSLHGKLKVRDDSIFDTILAISLLIQRYQLEIDKIYFNYNYEVTMYSGKIKILLGKQKYYDTQIADLKNILPIAKKKNLSGVLDMEDYTGDQSTVILRTE